MAVDVETKYLFNGLPYVGKMKAGMVLRASQLT